VGKKGVFYFFKWFLPAFAAWKGRGSQHPVILIWLCEYSADAIWKVGICWGVTGECTVRHSWVYINQPPPESFITNTTLRLLLTWYQPLLRGSPPPLGSRRFLSCMYQRVVQELLEKNSFDIQNVVVVKLTCRTGRGAQSCHPYPCTEQPTCS
jgi:hypothetical protein